MITEAVQIYDYTGALTEYFENPANIKAATIVRKWYNRWQQQIKFKELQARCLGRFGNGHTDIVDLFQHEIDTPALKLLLFLTDQRAQFSITSVHRMWQRLKALQQDHLLGYLRQKDLLEYIYRKELITGTMILGACLKFEAALQKFNDAWKSQTSVKFSFCEMIGCAFKLEGDDLKTVYKEWLSHNHPDKGGDPVVCARVIAAWKELTDQNDGRFL